MPSAVARLVSELTEEKARALLVELLTILRASLAKSLDPQSRLFTSLLFDCGTPSLRRRLRMYRAQNIWSCSSKSS